MSEFYGDVLTDDENENENDNKNITKTDKYKNKIQINNIKKNKTIELNKITIEYEILMYHLQLKKENITNDEKTLLNSKITKLKQQLEHINN